MLLSADCPSICHASILERNNFLQKAYAKKIEIRKKFKYLIIVKF